MALDNWNVFLVLVDTNGLQGVAAVQLEPTTTKIQGFEFQNCRLVGVAYVGLLKSMIKVTVSTLGLSRSFSGHLSRWFSRYGFMASLTVRSNVKPY